MEKPAIVVVDDGTFGPLLSQEISSRYGSAYSLFLEPSADAALVRLQGLPADQAALILGGRTAIDPLARTRAAHPHARRGLLLAWGENRSRREEVTRILGAGQADYFVIAPTQSPDERFHRALTQFLDEWWRLRGTTFKAIRVIGDERSSRIHEICDLLGRHDFPFGFYSNASAEGRALIAAADVTVGERDVVVLTGGRAFVNPTTVEVAEALGARTRAGAGVYDVVVVGAGPAGLAAAVSAASEGLRIGLVEGVALGGQAGTSSMIRNYLGFPRGISGAELAALAADQAILFGTELIYGTAAISLTTRGDRRVVGLTNGSEVVSKTVVIATGVSYRLLNIPGLEPFSGAGVFYGAAATEARALAGRHVHVVGGGNSAGQAAMYLAKFAKQVTILVRSGSLAQSMSEYLIRDIDAAPNVDVRYGVEVVEGGGDARLEWLELEERRSQARERVATGALFVLIGAKPCTEWQPASIVRDEGGYIVTGTRYEVASGSAPSTRGDERDPLLFETTLPGVFAVGDVRSRSVKRVASAAGEGSICVRLVHEYLARAEAINSSM